MFLARRWTILEKIFICSLIMLHLSLILPLSEVFPLPKTVTRPEAYADAPPNQSPIISSINGIQVVAGQNITLQAVDEGKTFFIEPRAYDPDGDNLTITFENLVKLPTSSVSVTGFRESGVWNTSYQDSGSYKTTVRVDDSKGGVATKDVYFTLNNIDIAPVVSVSLSKNVVNPGETFNIHVEVDDLDVEDTSGDVSPSDHPITHNGDSRIDTSQKKFGNGSLLLDGAGDYVSIPDNPDWDIVGSNADDWTIDLWANFDVSSGTDTILEQWQGNYDRWILHHSDGTLGFLAVNGGSEFLNMHGGAVSTGKWIHIAWVKKGNEYGLYIDGSQKVYAKTDVTRTFTGLLRLGSSYVDGVPSYFSDGHIDEVRISHRNEFNATPNQSLTDKITVPTQPHSSSLDTKLLLHFDIPNGEPLIPTLLQDGIPLTGIPSYIYGSGSFDKTYSINAAGIHVITARVKNQVTGATYEASANIEVVDTSAGANDIFPISGDFNGDGLTDIGTFEKKKGAWNVAISNDGEFDDVELWMSDFKGNNVDRTYSVTGDFNGDGRTDIALYETEGGNWRFAFSDGKKFIYDASWDITKFGGGSCNPLIGDFNGDGITDIGYSDSDPNLSSSNGRFWIRLAKEDRTDFDDKAILYQTNLDNSSTYSGDFNGDGLTDILAVKRDTGNWNTLLSQDTSSSELVDWVQNPATTGETIWTFPGNRVYGKHEDTYDGDFNTSYAMVFSASGGPGHTFHEETTFTFPQAVTITKVVAKAYNHSEFRNSGYNKVYLYFNNTWNEIGNVVNSEFGSGSTFTGNWTGVTGVRLVCNAYSHNIHTYTAWCKNYELQAWGPSAEVESNEGLLAFTSSSSWITAGFGANKEPVITDYNHDGKTDIGYFDTGKGEWHYALSDGTKFTEVSGAKWPSSFGQGEYNLPSGGDYNGDGIGDAAVFKRTAQGVLNKWQTKLHSSKQPDLLISVNNGIGGTTNIEYDLSTQFDNNGSDDKSDLPFNIPVVKKVTTQDSMGNSYEINYEYQDGMFEPNSREFRGFKYVKVTDSEGTIKETWFNQDDIYKGRPIEEKISDIYGRVYSSVQYEWDKTILYNGLVTFPYLVSKTSTLYNITNGSSRDVKTTYSNYDSYGNVGRIDELGFIDDGTDDRYTLIEYEYNVAKYIVGKPKRTTIKKGGTTVSESWFTYDSYGSLKEEKKWLSGGTNPTTRFRYDYETSSSIKNGNIVEVYDALGRRTTTQYSSTYAYTFPTRVTNALSQSQSFAYDYKTGQITVSTDPNSQVTETIYDTFGRVTKIIGPYDTSSSPGIEYSYDLSSRPLKITTTTKVDTGVTTTSYAFLDGLGRTIEVKTEADDLGGSRQLVSGIVKFDLRGQVKEKYLPYFVSTSPNYVAPTYGQPKITYEYDPIGRVIQTIRPDNVVSYAQYDGWTFTTIDENGHKTKSEKDAYGRLIKVFEYNGTEEYVTTYQYDTLGNLTKTIDSQGNQTAITYDSLGRKTSMDDPDMGRWQYSYDAVGNLISQTDAKGQTITFEYDTINRLKKKWGLSPGGTVPIFTVDYEYDVVSTANPYAKGRLTKVTDSSGTTEFFYDKLGRETKTVKTIGGTAYTIERTYDSIDRLKTVKYPDGEVVTYTYNKSGGVETIKGAGNYVTNIDYNEHGQMTRIDYGNGTNTNYSYNPNNLRLSQLVTRNSSLVTLQDLSYSFDGVGNVLSIVDNSPTGTNTQSFQYDGLNRLTKAIGESYGTINYTYDSIGNMTSRTSLRGSIAEAISYTYGEGSAGPHAVTSYQSSLFSRQINYDANGNMTQKEEKTGVRNFTYDIENRLIKVSEPNEAYISDYTISLQAGWNFVSIPLITTQDIATILQNSGIQKAQVSRYNAGTQSWQHFVYEQGRDLSRFNQFTQFEYGRGYQIYVDSACTLKVSGSPPITERSLTLEPGWNLISAPTTTSISVAEALPGITYVSINEYNGSAYTPVTQLQGGKSYFIKVSTLQTWNIPKQENNTTYVYDGDGGRVKKLSAISGQLSATTYIGSLYELTTEGGRPTTKKHIFLGSTQVCTIENNGTTTKRYYFHEDHIGSSNVITDETGAITKLLEYSPYGLTSREEGSYNTDCKFTGKLFDTSTALYYYGARYYDPELGRFIQPDTIVPYPSDPQSFNRYAYARNNPIRYIDPTGHFWWAIIAAVVGAIVGAISAHEAGGNVWAGAAVGAACGYFGAGLANIAISAMGIGAGIGVGATASSSWGGSIITPMEGALITGTEFAIGGFAAGLASGYAGGEGSVGDMFAQAGIGAAIGFGTGFATGYSYTAGWQSVLHGADTRVENAKIYKQKIIALRADCKNRLDQVPKIIGDRYLADKSGDPGKFGFKHRFIGLRNPWEMGPYKGMINTSNTVEDLSNWGTHITTQRAIASRAINIYRTTVSASGLKEAQALFEQCFAGQPYMATDRNSNFAVNTVIYGAGGDVPEDDLWTMGFPGKIQW